MQEENWQERVVIEFEKSNVEVPDESLSSRLNGKTVFLDANSQREGKTVYISSPRRTKNKVYILDSNKKKFPKNQENKGYLGYLPNADQFVIGDIKKDTVTPLDLTTISYEEFIKLFTVNNEQPTLAQYNKIKNNAKIAKEFEDKVLAELQNTKTVKSGIQLTPIASSMEPAKGIMTLEEFSKVNKVETVIDRRNNKNVLTGDHGTPTNYNIEGNYTADIVTKSGVKTTIAVHPITLESTKISSTLTSVVNKINEINNSNLSLEDIESKSKELQEEIDNIFYIHDNGSKEGVTVDGRVIVKPGSRFEFNYNVKINKGKFAKSSPKLYLKLQSGRNNRVPLGSELKIKDVSSIEAIIAHIEKATTGKDPSKSTSPVVLQKEAFRKSLRKGKIYKLSDFIASTSLNVFKGYNFAVQYPSSQANTPTTPTTPTPTGKSNKQDDSTESTSIESIKSQFEQELEDLESGSDATYLEDVEELRIKYKNIIKEKVSDRGDKVKIKTTLKSKLRASLKRKGEDKSNVSFNIRKGNALLSKEWLDKNLPNIPVDLRDNLIKIDNSYVSGMFMDGIISLSKYGEIGTEYHEAFHAVFSIYLTPKERKAILGEQESTKPVTEEEINKLKSIKAYRNLSDAKLKEIVLEERVANLFQTYVLEDKSPSTLRKFFNFILDSINWIVGNPIKSDALFRKITSGGFKSATPMGVLNIEPKYNIGNLNQIETKNLISAVAANVLQEVREGEITLSDLDPTKSIILNVINDSIDNLVDYYEGMEGTDLEDVAERYLEVIEEDEEYKKELSLEVSKLFKDYTTNFKEDDSLLIEEEGPERKFDVSLSDTGSLKNMNKEVKLFIQLTSYERIDEFGQAIPSLIDFRGTHDLLKRSLSNLTRAEQLQRIKELKLSNVQVAAVINNLENVVGSLEENTIYSLNQKALVTKFFNHFTSVSLDPQQALYHPGKQSSKVISGNSNDTKHILLHRWKMAHISKIAKLSKSEIREISTLLKSGLYLGKDSVVKNRVSLISEQLNRLGIDLSTNYIKYLITPSKNVRKDDIFKLTEDLVNYIEYDLINDNNLFEYVEDVGGSVGTLTNLAEADTFFRSDLFTSTYKNADNETQNSFVLPSFMYRKLKELKSIFSEVSTTEELLEEEYNSFNSILQESAEDIKEMFSYVEINPVGDIRALDGDDVDSISARDIGKTFKNLTSADYTIHQHVLYNNPINNTKVARANGKKSKKTFVYYTTDVKEAKSSSYGTLLERREDWATAEGEVSDVAIDHIRNTMFKQEYKRIKGDFGTKFKANQFLLLPFLNNNLDKLGLKFKLDSKGNPTQEVIVDKDSEIKGNLDNIPNEVINTLIKEGLTDIVNNYSSSLKQEKLITSATQQEGIRSSLTRDFANEQEYNNYITNYVINFMVNSTGINQLLFGDMAKHKNFINVAKRASGSVAAGNSGSGLYRVVYGSEYFIYVDATTNKEITKAEFDKLTKNDPSSAFKIDADDAQVLTTLSWREKSLDYAGKYTEEVDKVFKKLKENKELTEKDLKYVDLISEKGVHYDSTTYHKMSEFVLIPELTTNRDGTPKAGRERLHNIRLFLENNNVDKYVPISGSKITSENVLNAYDFNNSSILETYSEANPVPFTELRGEDYRIQLENASGKEKIVLATQLLQQIDAELPSSSDYDPSKTEEQNKSEKENYDLRMRLYETLRDVVEQAMYSASTSSDSDSILSAKFISSILNSGGSPTIASMLETVNDGKDSKFKYNVNLPPLKNKTLQLFLAHFNKEVLSQKVEGNKSTLVSSVGFDVIYDKATGEIITDSSKYDKNKHGLRSLNIHKKENGKIKLAEVFMTRRQAKSLGINSLGMLDEAQNEGLLDMLGIRIPTQSHHSMIPFRVVGFLPEVYGDVIVAPSEIVRLSGADYDVDSLYSQRYKLYTNENGDLVKYGTEKSLEGKWKEFKSYHIANNKDLKVAAQVSFKDKDSFFVTNMEMLEGQINELTNKRRSFQAKIKSLKDSKIGNNTFKLPEEGITAENVASLAEKLSPESKKEALQTLQDEVFNISKIIEDKVVELSEQKEQLVISVFAEVGLPRNLEEFKTYKYKKTKGELDNTLLETMLEIMSKEELEESMFTPATMTGLEEDADLIFTKILGKVETSYSLNTPQGVKEAWFNNAVGKKTVGPSANFSTISAFLTKMKIRLAKPTITMNGVSYDTYANGNENDLVLNLDENDPTKYTLGSEVRRKADTLSTVVSSATDNAKERLMAKLNLSQSNLSFLSNLLALGYGRTRTMVFANVPIIRDLTNSATNSESAFLNSEKLSMSVSENIVNLAEKVGIELTPDVKESLGSGLTDDDMVGLLLQNTSGQNELAELKVLIAFERVIKASFPVLSVGKILKINKGVGTDALDLIDRLDAAKELGLVTEGQGKHSKVFTNLIEALDENVAVRDNVTHLQTVVSKVKTRFIPFSDKVRDTITRAGNSIFLTPVEREKFADKFTNFLGLNHLEFKLGLDSSNYNDLLFPNEEGQSIVDKYYEHSGDEAFLNNNLIKYLYPERANAEGLPIDTISFNNRIDITPEIEEMFKGAFEDLLSSSVYRDFAKSLINYLNAKDGYQFKGGSFISILPDTTFKPLSNSFDSIVEILKNNKSFEDEFGRTFKSLQNEFLEKYIRGESNLIRGYSTEGYAVTSSSENSISYDPGPVNDLINLEERGNFGIITTEVLADNKKVSKLTYRDYVKITNNKDTSIYKLQKAPTGLGVDTKATYRKVTALKGSRFISGHTTPISKLEEYSDRIEKSRESKFTNSIIITEENNNEFNLDKEEEVNLESLEGDGSFSYTPDTLLRDVKQKNKISSEAALKEISLMSSKYKTIANALLQFNKEQKEASITSKSFQKEFDEGIDISGQTITELGENSYSTNVLIDIDKLNKKQDNSNKEDLEEFIYETVIHEEIHRSTNYIFDLVRHYNNNSGMSIEDYFTSLGLGPQNIVFYNEVTELYNQYLENPLKDTGGIEIDSITEFMSYGLSNKRLIEHLKATEVNNVPLLESLINSLIKLFKGTKTFSLYDALLQSVENYADNAESNNVNVLQFSKEAGKTSYSKVTNVNMVGRIGNDSIAINSFKDMLNITLDSQFNSVSSNSKIQLTDADIKAANSRIAKRTNEETC